MKRVGSLFKGATFLFVGLISLGIRLGSAAAEDTDSPPSKLDGLRQQMQQTQSQIDTLVVSLRSIRQEVQTLSSSIKTLKDKEAKIHKDLDKNESSKAEIQKLVQDTEGRLLELELRSQARIRALYRMQEEQTPTLIFSKGFETFSRAAVYMRSIKKMDTQDAEEIVMLRGKRDIETGKVAELVHQQQELLSDLQTQRKTIEGKLDLQNKKTAEFQKQKKDLETGIIALRAQELRLETVLKSITGGSTSGVTAAPESVSGAGEGAGFEGTGLKGSKAEPLFNPSKGTLVKKFGQGEGVTKKGILIRSTEGAVMAAAEGKVVFVGVLPQLGSVVILDHGNRDFTLYGKLSTVTAALGVVVPAGDSIGVPQDPDKNDKESANVYFEIRRKGVSVDPLLNRYASR